MLESIDNPPLSYDEASDQSAALATALVEAIRDTRFDEAEALLERLNEIDPSTEDHLVFPVIIAVQRGYITESLQYLNSLGEDTAPELKALCLNILGDPTWHGYAQRGLDSADPYVRSAMRDLLQMEPEEEALQQEAA